jgi:hypothetical protein
VNRFDLKMPIGPAGSPAYDSLAISKHKLKQLGSATLVRESENMAGKLGSSRIERGLLA